MMQVRMDGRLRQLERLAGLVFATKSGLRQPGEMLAELMQGEDARIPPAVRAVLRP